MPEQDSGLRAEVAETVNMLRAYVVQETVGPLRGLGRYVLLGLIGAVGVSIAVVLASLAAMRVLQAETNLFNANWSFVPYLAGIAILVLAIALLIRAIKPGRDSSPTTSRTTQETTKHATGDNGEQERRY